MTSEIYERRRSFPSFSPSDSHFVELLKAGKLNIWEWDLITNERIDFGYSQSLSQLVSHSDGKDILNNFLLRVHPDDRDQIANTLEKSRTNLEDCSFEYRIKLTQGEYEWVSARGRYICDANGMPIKMIGTWHFITNEKKNQELMRQQQNALARISRAYSMGELATTLAHEISQPLLAINTYLTGSLRRLRENDMEKIELIDVLETAVAQVELTANIIKRIKNYVTQGELQREKVNILPLIEKVLTIIKSTFNYLGTIRLELDDNLSDIKVDRSQIKQVFLNLISNALEAMHTAQTPNPCLIIRAQRASNTLNISIIDNGPGISEECIENLFTPFFTTKKNGLGIGLSICRSIIELHGGHISIARCSNSGGTISSFTLPIHFETGLKNE